MKSPLHMLLAMFLAPHSLGCAEQAASPSASTAETSAATAEPAAERPASVPERTGIISRKGEPRTLLGAALKVGDDMPSFVLVDPRQADVVSSPYAGKNLVISVVPSLDTEICETQTGRMTSEAEGYGADTVLLTISRDLPFAQGRYLESHGATSLGSDFKDGSFGRSFGVLIKESGLLARSLWLIGADGKIVYREIVAEQSSEPDYDAFNDALAKLTGVTPAAAAAPAGAGPSSAPAP